MFPRCRAAARSSCWCNAKTMSAFPQGRLVKNLSVSSKHFKSKTHVSQHKCLKIFILRTYFFLIAAENKKKIYFSLCLCCVWKENMILMTIRQPPTVLQSIKTNYLRKWRTFLTNCNSGGNRHYIAVEHCKQEMKM